MTICDTRTVYLGFTTTYYTSFRAALVEVETSSHGNLFPYKRINFLIKGRDFQLLIDIRKANNITEECRRLIRQ